MASVTLTSLQCGHVLAMWEGGQKKAPRKLPAQALVDLLWDSEDLRGPDSFLWALAAAGISEAEAWRKSPKCPPPPVVSRYRVILLFSLMFRIVSFYIPAQYLI